MLLAESLSQASPSWRTLCVLRSQPASQRLQRVWESSALTEWLQCLPTPRRWCPHA